MLALSPLKRPMMLSLTCESVLVIALQFFCATFEAYIGIRDDEATAQLKLLGDYLLVLCFNLSIVNQFCSFFFLSKFSVIDISNDSTS